MFQLNFQRKTFKSALVTIGVPLVIAAISWLARELFGVDESWVIIGIAIAVLVLMVYAFIQFKRLTRNDLDG